MNIERLHPRSRRDRALLYVEGAITAVGLGLFIGGEISHNANSDRLLSAADTCATETCRADLIYQGNFDTGVKAMIGAVAVLFVGGAMMQEADEANLRRINLQSVNEQAGPAAAQ